MSQDPASRDNPNRFLSDPQQLNSYSYVANNPLKYVDPSGEFLVRALVATATILNTANHLRNGIGFDSRQQMEMNVSQQGVQFIADYETYRGTVYDDGYSYMTVGYGHRVLPGEDFSAGLSEAQAKELLANDLEPRVQAVNKGLTRQVTQNQFDAYVSYVFNVGHENFSEFRTTKSFNRGDLMGALRELATPVTAGGEYSFGLDRRRMDEMQLFLNGDYSRDYPSKEEIESFKDSI